MDRSEFLLSVGKIAESNNTEMAHATEYAVAVAVYECKQCHDKACDRCGYGNVREDG